MSGELILAIDQGTSATKAIIFNSRGQVVAKATSAVESLYPSTGFVEQDPQEIYKSVLDSAAQCLQVFKKAKLGDIADVRTCGISNQRETFLLWDNEGNPITNAIVWQCKRSVDICAHLKGTQLEDEIKSRTGLIADPYFSGTKLIWLYQNNEEVRDAIKGGTIYFGTVDTWLLYRLTGGRQYFTDYTNACRTLLFNIHSLQWDAQLLEQFHLERLNLPKPKPSAYAYGESDFENLFPTEIPITSMIGDSHAAAFGEQCFQSGEAKATLGTGSSILLNTGDQRISSRHGMMTTICYSTTDRVDYALEGVIVTCGATLTWLRDQLGLFASSEETEEMAKSVKDNGGVFLIPAFSGLGAPHWKMNLKGSLVGLTFGSTKNHVVRAALESIAFQIGDVVTAMESDSGIALKELKADGGITANNFVMQMLADLLDSDVVNIGIPDVSALGAAYLAGLQHGIFRDIEHLTTLVLDSIRFHPGKEVEKVRQYYLEWQRILKDIS